MFILETNLSLTFLSREPAGYVMSGGEQLYSFPVLFPLKSQGRILPASGFAVRCNRVAAASLAALAVVSCVSSLGATVSSSRSSLLLFPGASEAAKFLDAFKRRCWFAALNCSRLCARKVIGVWNRVGICVVERSEEDAAIVESVLS